MSPKLVVTYLKDHLDVIDFVLDIVKQNRKITKRFILELHQKFTQNQDTIDAINTLENIVKVTLLKSKFKNFENKPRLIHSAIYQHFPSNHLYFDFNYLTKILQRIENENIEPVLIFSWFHHAFTQTQ